MEQLGGQVIAHIGNFPITNTLTSVIVVDIIILTFAAIIYFKASFIPGKIQNLFELLFEYIYNLAKTILPKKYVAMFAPILATFFIFILLNNWLGLLPGIGSIYVKIQNLETNQTEQIALFKGANADLNITLALATTSFLFVILATLIFKGPRKWLGHYLHTKPYPLLVIFIPMAIMELLMEPLKFISLSLRLFGNILAGETLVDTMLAFPGMALPFLLLEVLVGILQALIFTGLTLAFLAIFFTEEEETAH
jgi:F-type H+-transporting ATPase subunit a